MIIGVHEKGECSIEHSVNFLDRYLQELNVRCRFTENERGKTPILNPGNASIDCHQVCMPPEGTKNVWKAPEEGWIKINVDASFIQEREECSLGCVARNSDGKVIWASNRSNIRCKEVFEAESRACLLGLQCIHDSNVSLIVLESDNAGVVEAIGAQNQTKSRLWSLFAEIKRLSLTCKKFVIQKIGREGNLAAHLLAAAARNHHQNHLWLGSVPPAIAEVVAAEAVIAAPDV